MPDEAAGDWPSAPLIFRKVPNAFLNALFRLGWGLRVVGVENVPLNGPLIVATNHVANLDGPLVAIAVSGRRYLRGLGKIELYRVPVLGWFLKNTGTIPLDRRGDVGAMRAAASIIAQGGALGIMPEGTRSRDGKPGKPRAGVAFLAALTGAPVVPARLVGTDRWPLPCRLEVRFGKPLRFAGSADDRPACLAFAQKVMDDVFSL